MHLNFLKAKVFDQLSIFNEYIIIHKKTEKVKKKKKMILERRKNSM